MGYARWLKNQPTIIGKFPEIEQFLETKFQDNDNSYLLNFGKHKNRTINWIHENDLKYFEWLSKNDYVAKNIPLLKQEINKIISENLSA